MKTISKTVERLSRIAAPRYASFRGPLFAAAAALLAPMAAHAQSPLDAWIDGAAPIADIRARYESVDDAGKKIRANAYTLRARLGFQTGTWNGLSALAEMDVLWDINSAFNSTRNRKTSYPVVADPEMAALNRLELSYVSDFGTAVAVGRQRILLGDQRFVGNSGWRQHEQTFDALTVTNTSLPGLAASYSYVNRVNRVYGPGAPFPASGPAGA